MRLWAVPLGTFPNVSEALWTHPPHLVLYARRYFPAVDPAEVLPAMYLLRDGFLINLNPLTVFRASAKSARKHTGTRAIYPARADLSKKQSAYRGGARPGSPSIIVQSGLPVYTRPQLSIVRAKDPIVEDQNRSTFIVRGQQYSGSLLRSPVPDKDRKSSSLGSPFWFCNHAAVVHNCYIYVPHNYVPDGQSFGRMDHDLLRDSNLN
ncbi:hypothetical protein K491DRAFT_72099 [Lophiostoma macrostomum CBS 122681]|uniref:Uncharacterized protein n=1 Tax=Lophiostoma macrostomum CBS 122681 TaxID=1314788 RepID=A0A6A6SWJ7_9PLEO|nr:hypothetical protein K491DRAFT_72099 [Lophiostoma macrostomum CBS 122681]